MPPPKPWMIALGLALLTLALYSRALTCDFISYDDPEYVTANPHIQHGIGHTLAWCFTTGYAANYFPLTWISHAIDWQIYGRRPWGHHLTAILLHAANASLCFIALHQLTQRPWRSAFIAAVFALHPLRVESVAWIAERKDVLSAFFFLLTLIAYARYVRHSSPLRYLLVLGLFLLGLLAKPMVITLPLILLLLDYWPLNRIRDRRSAFRCTIEKTPLFFLGLAAAAVTIYVQHQGGAVATFGRVSIVMRINNALLSYVRYLGKTFLPIRLGVFYPMPTTWPLVLIAFAALLLLVITTLAIRWYRLRPWLLVGWLWYLIMLLPVIGLIQVGDQALADRYTYLPHIGVFIILTWAVAELMPSLPIAFKTSTASAALFILAALTWRQIGYWHNSETLFRHTANVTRDNWLAYNHLATALASQRRFPQALAAAHRAAEINPDTSITHFNLANILRQMNDLPAAQRAYQQALQRHAHFPAAHNNLATTLAMQGDLTDAEREFRAAIADDPDYADAWANLALLLAQQLRPDEARAAANRALQLDPDNPTARRALARLQPPR
jgi:tetratricopeptide (TPR) repeat protein